MLSQNHDGCSSHRQGRPGSIQRHAPWLLWVTTSVKIISEERTLQRVSYTQATRRLLLRVEIVHAVSWLWASEVPSIINAAVEGTGGDTLTTPTPLVSMLPVLRRRAGRPRVLLAALFRNSTKS